MKKSLSITGSRDVKDEELVKHIAKRYMNFLLEKGINITTIHSGCARGVDKLAEVIAKESYLEFKEFPANWDIGKHAGMLRNKEMANETHLGLVFWDEESKGTEHYINYFGRCVIYSLKQNKFIFNKRYCSFSGYYRFLSNMYVLKEPIILEGKSFRTTEHYYQWKKVGTEDFYKTISEITSPGKLKRVMSKLIKDGTISIREDFFDNRLKIMEKALTKKFEDPELLKKLININGEIIEWNYWNDMFWGKSIYDGKGENNLGKLLMKIRDYNKPY